MLTGDEEMVNIEIQVNSGRRKIYSELILRVRTSIRVKDCRSLGLVSGLRNLGVILLVCIWLQDIIQERLWVTLYCTKGYHK